MFSRGRCPLHYSVVLFLSFVPELILKFQFSGLKSINFSSQSSQRLRRAELMLLIPLSLTDAYRKPEFLFLYMRNCLASSCDGSCCYSTLTCNLNDNKHPTQDVKKAQTVACLEITLLVVIV